MRALTCYENTTPTYQFNITDDSDYPLDTNKMKIGMSIYLIVDGASQPKYLLLPKNSEDFKSDFFDLKVPGLLVYNSDWLCYGHEDNDHTYFVTIPLGITPDKYHYQVFLFKNESIKNPKRQEYSNRLRIVVIDSGTFEVLPGGFPTLSDNYKLDGKRYYIPTDPSRPQEPVIPIFPPPPPKPTPSRKLV